MAKKYETQSSLRTERRKQCETNTKRRILNNRHINKAKLYRGTALDRQNSIDVL